MMTWVVGLTGGIGSGKSTAASCFAALGAAVIDTDAIAHELTAAGGKALEPLRAAFGAQRLTAAGGLDRVAMRQLIFAEPVARARLEAILHPLIRTECEDRLRSVAAAAPAAPYAILVVPLLLETEGFRHRVARVCVVDCPEETQIARTMARSRLSRAEVLAIMATQASRAARLAAADDVIDNAADTSRLQKSVATLHESYRQLASPSV